ncbi:LAME_0D10440g1_1 [Lachancea meyersii CBS 8951]|uniref:Palmitoyltransferase PFA4 n=1 Tax=Lachancea meyersii CBS 8951 TaxID=1266667 RepID=A0A1G4JBR4_9SACH|nr:LAME_0D10440g1_1 [Lachancea meyersii CBS 8951]
MPVKLKWPWLGVAIPCFLIAFIGYTSHYFILSNFASSKQQILFEFPLSMTWISYALAIYVKAGSPPAEFRPRKEQWTHYCKICKNYKPERSHHCKSCGKCILLMDHHCPWTMNCVGYRNFPHFMRFLLWVITTTAYLQFMLTKRVLQLWRLRHTRIFIHKSELCFLVTNILLNAFVCFSISMLLIRCIKNQLLEGRTQIESWEMERIENLFNRRRLLPQLIENLNRMFPDQKHSTESKSHDLASNKILQVEDVVNFPYDLGFMANVESLMGPKHTWLLPWGGPSGSGCHFETNDLAIYEPDAPLEDRLMALPWPPDGGRQMSKHQNQVDSNVSIHNSRGEAVLKKRPLDTAANSNRRTWQNDWGETLADFGVDVDADAEL